MKKIIYFSVFFIISLCATAFSQDKASPLTLLQLYKFENDAKFRKLHSMETLSGMIKVNDKLDENLLKMQGVKIRTRAGNIYTVSFTSESLRYLMNAPGIDYVQLDEPIEQLLDSARSGIGTDAVHIGTVLNSTGFTGKGVIVGIVDSGFDYANPVFYDSVSNKLRISRVWELKKEGRPPVGYDYGNELLTPEEIYAEKYDINTSSHGTHVGSIAAGNGNLSDSRLIGMAPEAELVFVGIRPEPEEWKSSGVSSVIDAFSYIFDYAESQGKPAVINLSWGISIGPRNGTSLFNQACNNLIKPGRAITISAGNSGRDDLHFNYTFSEQDTLFHTFIEFNPNAEAKYTWIDCWAEKENVFELSFQLYNKDSGTFSTDVLKVDTEASSIGSITLLSDNGDSCKISYVINKVDFNGKTRALFDIESFTDDYVMISGKGSEGELHIWSGIIKLYSGYPSTFTNLYLPWAKSGNRKNVVNDLSTADSVFSCAAYTSKNRWTSVDGDQIYFSGYIRNYIAPFSSQGPALSSATKPDIAAPGAFLEAAVNTYDGSFDPDSSSRWMLTRQIPIDDTEDYHRFAALAGTSMAAPCTAGAIALMFEAEPTLSTAQIREIFKRTALKNMYYTTTDIWGVGILQIDKALQDLLGITSINELVNSDEIEIISQNSETITFKLNNENLSDLTLHVYDISGRLIISNKVRSSEQVSQINISQLQSGAYILRLFNNKSNFKCKFIK